MAFVASLSVSSPHLSSSFSGDSFSSSFILISGTPLCTFSPPTLSGKSYAQKHLVVISRKLSGLEEAMRIKRERDVRGTPKMKKKLPLRRGKVSGRLLVPDHIPKPPYVSSSLLPELSPEPQIHDSDGITRMKAACELAARVLDYAGTLVRPSVTTNEIDKAVHEMIINAGAYPSPLGYGGFPKSVCTSVNECMCHGIPDSRQLQDGDIINIDVTVHLNVTEECLQRAISVCKHGESFKKIGKRISDHAERFGYGVVERFVGHGVGTIFHSDPIILHNRNNKPGYMVEGQTFTIEPILSMGSIECVTWDDNWTTLTVDGSLAAQFEHTLLITRTGAEVLTKY
ncbi:methionine aminopeptidase 1B isoform X2 [Tasmannia lanceolata]|uniref:methionine aminopeptidase 1B isoform X2 n=1 Tax=Tasmannia lanceolata TaxID=3420 RepID=UPI0040628628